MSEFKTIQYDNKGGYGPVTVQGSIIGQWGVYKSSFGYNVVYIPMGSGIGTFDKKTMAMVIARKANEILGYIVEKQTDITQDMAVALKRMVIDMKHTDVTKMYRTNGLPKQ